MDLTQRLAVSYYKTIATINEPHKVYLVQHQETNQIYIKKVLDIYNADIYKHLHSNHITGTPKIIDCIEENNQLTVIEEFISGKSLKDYIEQAELTITDITCYMLDLCSIIKKLHSQNPAIIHRDIKPSNVIITSYNRAVLLDFNAAKYYSEHSMEDTILLGTQGYAAPEQYGFGSSSPQTDIYSMGILFKEMLSSIGYSSDKTASIIDKCTRINPSERYKNISAFKSDLSTLVKPAPKSGISLKLSRYTLPGFRTKRPWKMLTASLYYLFITLLFLSVEVKDTYGLKLFINRLFFISVFLSIPFVCLNYLNIQKLLPLCQSKHILVRYAGIIILNFLLIFGLFILLFIAEKILFPS